MYVDKPAGRPTPAAADVKHAAAVDGGDSRRIPVDLGVLRVAQSGVRREVEPCLRGPQTGRVHHVLVEPQPEELRPELVVRGEGLRRGPCAGRDGMVRSCRAQTADCRELSVDDEQLHIAPAENNTVELGPTGAEHDLACSEVP